MATKLSLVPAFLHELAAWLEGERIVVIKRERGRRVLAERLATELPPFADRDGFAGSATDLHDWLSSQRHLFAVPGRDRALYRALRLRMLPRVPSAAAQARAAEVLAALHEMSRIPRATLDEHHVQAAQNLDYEARPDWVDVDATLHARGFCQYVPHVVVPHGLLISSLAPVLEAQRRGVGEPAILDAQESLYEWDMSWDPGTGRWEGSTQVQLSGVSELVEVELSLVGERDHVPDVAALREVLADIDQCFVRLCEARGLDRTDALLWLDRLRLVLDGSEWSLRAAVYDEARMYDAGE